MQAAAPRAFSSPWRGEGGAPSLSPAYTRRTIRGLRREGLSDRGAPGGGVSTQAPPPPGTPSDLARLSAVGLSVAVGELSPWRSVLPPQGGGGARGAGLVQGTRA